MVELPPDAPTWEPVPGLQISVLSNGWMELHAPGSSEALLCTSQETAMWVALSRHGWSLGDAALMLSRNWGVEPWTLRDQMSAWLEQLANSGFVAR